jgi:hypothetical protein
MDDFAPGAEVANAKASQQYNQKGVSNPHWCKQVMVSRYVAATPKRVDQRTLEARYFVF